MADSMTAAGRSAMMARIKGKDTRPELTVRRILHAAGFRYRLHAKDLPGRPDIVLRSLKTLVFVNGCFWHGTRLPKSNRRYWRPKIEANIGRDIRNYGGCRGLGWRILVIWECSLRGKKRLSEKRLGMEMSEWIQRDAKRTSIKQIRGRR